MSLVCLSRCVSSFHYLIYIQACGQAASDRIIREIELFGADFERYERESTVKTDTATAADAPPTSTDKSRKGKAPANPIGPTCQFKMMEAIGVPRSEIKKFADPLYWTKYFPPIAKVLHAFTHIICSALRITQVDNNSFGSRIDWRRTMLTTDINPYYDSFVRWQVNKLYKLGKIKFGERYTIYSPKDRQPCMDHDRQDGEGVGPQEYTALRMEVVQWSEAVKKAIENSVGGRKVYFIAATLRPETMCVLIP